MLDLISDGYTIRARIHAVKGQNNQLDFRYRPLAGDEGERRNLDINKQHAAEVAGVVDPQKPSAEELKARLIADRLVEWSVKEADGKPAPIAVATVRRLPTVVFYSLYMTVLGFKSPDAELDDEGNEIKATTLGDNEKN